MALRSLARLHDQVNRPLVLGHHHLPEAIHHIFVPNHHHLSDLTELRVKFFVAYFTIFVQVENWKQIGKEFSRKFRIYFKDDFVEALGGN